ncbi:TPA: IS21 family transposase, partial [Vibrio cholerae]|nr:IS21 family transposase [Vibrio cholerae]
MALLSVIRRWYFREGLSKREIARRTGLSRNTLKKYLSQEQVEPAYPQRACVSKLDAFETLLTEALEREVKKPRKQRKTVKQLYHELVPQGYTGSYDRVAAFARLWRQQQTVSKQVYVPLQFAPGEAFQFDWGENWVSIGGKKVKVQVAHFKLCHSKVSYQRAYWTQTHEMLFDAHTQAFRVFG